VQTFHEPPSLRPRYSSLSAVGHPRAGTKLHRAGNPRLGKVNGKTHNYRGRLLSQEPLTPTAHRLSFPTCLSYPRSIHLLCHQDSPSIAKPPLPWALRQTGPEVSELCGSYRTPSQSSHFLMHSLTWRGSLAGLTTCFLQLGFRHSRGNHKTQHGHKTTNKPHAVQNCVATTTNWTNMYELSQNGDSQALRHSKAQQLRDIWVSPTNNKGQTHGFGFRDA
jgi:hypothetical protein